MKTLKPNGLKVLKIFHLLFASMWLGGAIAMALLLCIVTPQGNNEMYIFGTSLKTIDDLVIIVGATGCLLTGIVYGVWSKFGFFRLRWITAKWILLLLMTISGTFIMGPLVNDNVLPYTEITRYSDISDQFFANEQANLWWGVAQVVMLLITVIISVFKPWKKKQTGKPSLNVAE